MEELNDSSRGLGQEQWDDIVRRGHVLVGIYEVVRRAVVDELRRTEMRDGVQRVLKDHPLRILGLTASFVNGSLKDIERKRSDLESVMQSTVYCPDVQDNRSVDYEEVEYDYFRCPPEDEACLRSSTKACMQESQPRPQMHISSVRSGKA